MDNNYLRNHGFYKEHIDPDKPFFRQLKRKPWKKNIPEIIGSVFGGLMLALWIAVWGFVVIGILLGW